MSVMFLRAYVVFAVDFYNTCSVLPREKEVRKYKEGDR